MPQTSRVVTCKPRTLTETRAFDAMMDTTKIDVAGIEAVRLMRQ
ncbi:hypothetical protein [Mesorhizobium sp. STM 4661]|nr:hypothetical protein [Mesorhizobium sp. STM 4661]